MSFASWLERRRLWLAGDIHRPKKVSSELDAENGEVFGDLDLFDCEDILRFIMGEPDFAVRIGLCLALEAKLK